MCKGGGCPLKYVPAHHPVPSKLDGNVLLHLTMMVSRSLHDVALRGDVPTFNLVIEGELVLDNRREVLGSNL
jgi:hypothetical protein